MDSNRDTMRIATAARELADHFTLCAKMDHKGSWERYARIINDALDAWDRDRKRLRAYDQMETHR